MSDFNNDVGDFSIGKEAANFASTFIKNNLTAIQNKTFDLLKGAKNEIRLRLESTYKTYLTNVGTSHSTVRTFLITQYDKNLHEIYVPLGVSLETLHFPNLNLADLIKGSRLNVITGSAGSGKSMMMRFLFLDSIKRQLKIPVFIELRELNSSEDTLFELIEKKLIENGFDFKREFIERAFDLGHFILFLDGFDEIADDRRGLIENEIAKLAGVYEKLFIVISSRPEDYFLSLSRFQVWKMNDLTLEKACQLIEKLPYNEEIKEKFIADLQDKLFEEHEYFLSNPLLLSIMWLCYGENASIPKKYSLFYQQAYEALFNKHDARKGGFERSTRTLLDIKDFADTFSAFAVQTYDEDKVTFSETDAIDYLNKAKKITGIEFNSKDFLWDTIKAVCLLLEDGLKIKFSHRSFQEYFTACFIINAQPKIQEGLLLKYSESRYRQDNVIELAHSIKAETVEKLLIIPEIEKLEKLINYKNKTDWEVVGKYLAEVYSHVVLTQKRFSHIGKDYSEDELELQVKNWRLFKSIELISDKSELETLYQKSERLFQSNKSRLISTFKNAQLKNPYNPIPIHGFVKDKRLLEKFIEAGFGLKLQRFIIGKKILVEKYHEQADSLFDILGL